MISKENIKNAVIGSIIGFVFVVVDAWLKRFHWYSSGVGALFLLLLLLLWQIYEKASSFFKGIKATLVRVESLLESIEKENLLKKDNKNGIKGRERNETG